MKQTETEKTLQADPELDAVLEQMADEVPPMPADFHDKWMSAIRAEAKQQAAAAEDRKEKKIVSINRWTRILSVAAAFVFLIGGTVLYRRSKYYDAFEEEMDFDMTPAVMTEAPETASEEAVYAETAAGAVKTEGAVNAASAARETSTAAKSASNAEEPVTYDMEPMTAMDAVMEDAAEEAAVEYETAAEYEAAEMPAAEPAVTASPTAAVTPEATAEPEEEADDRLAGVKGFLADMGEFLLAALPYLLVLAVPAAAALVIRHRKKGKKE